MDREVPDDTRIYRSNGKRNVGNSTNLLHEKGHTLSASSSPTSADIVSDRASSGASSARTSTAVSLSTTMTSGMPPEMASPHLQHPNITIIELTSTSSTSSAFPETLAFHVSRKGQAIITYNSTHIWVIRAQVLPRTFMRVFEVRRRPLAVDILDDDEILAVLASPHKVDLFRLNTGSGGTGVERIRSIFLGNPTSSIAMSPDGLVLATGHRGGIELVSLAVSAIETDRRAITCTTMDSLCFSEDGRVLLATSPAKRYRETTVFSVVHPFDAGPLTEEGPPTPEEVDKAWIRQILFPDVAKDARQATLLPDCPTGIVNELVAFDSIGDTFGIFDLATMRFTKIKFELPDARWSRTEKMENATPAVSPGSDNVALALREHGTSHVWVFELPENWQDESRISDSTLVHTISVEINSDEHLSFQGIVCLRWVFQGGPSLAKRLIAVGSTKATAASGDPTLMSLPATGRVVVMDFEPGAKSTRPAPKKLTIDLDQILPGMRLPDEELTFEREVELVRTQTVIRRNTDNRRSSVGMSRTLTRGALPSNRSGNLQAPTLLRRGSEDEETEDEQVQAAYEPYSQSHPRSPLALHRAATVAAASPASRRHLRALPDRPLEYRRADGLREIPHESDADNWVPPPPPYSPRADPPGPDALSISLTFPEPPLPYSHPLSSVSEPGMPMFPRRNTDELTPPVQPTPIRGQLVPRLSVSRTFPHPHRNSNELEVVRPASSPPANVPYRGHHHASSSSENGFGRLFGLSGGDAPRPPLIRAQSVQPYPNQLSSRLAYGTGQRANSDLGLRSLPSVPRARTFGGNSYLPHHRSGLQRMNTINSVSSQGSRSRGQSVNRDPASAPQLVSFGGEYRSRRSGLEPSAYTNVEARRRHRSQDDLNGPDQSKERKGFRCVVM